MCGGRERPPYKAIQTPSNPWTGNAATFRGRHAAPAHGPNAVAAKKRYHGADVHGGVKTPPYRATEGLCLAVQQPLQGVVFDITPDLQQFRFVAHHMVIVGSLPQGAAAAAEMAEAGCGAIELCGGFGIRGTYLVEQAVAGKARVGAVRFDLHPGLENKSGDELF